MSDRPLIGVTSSELRAAETVHRPAHGEPPRREMALGLAYLKAIERAGGLPVVIAPLALGMLDSLLDRLGALCLSGGPDLDPGTYGQPSGGCLGPIDPEVDAFELELMRRADRRRMPVLGVCRGAQVLNVSRGGTLVQDLPSDRPSTVAHRQPTPGSEPTHLVSLEPASLVASLLGRSEVRVNSFHHQATDRVGDGLRPVGFAPDGVVEALEDPDSPFVVGVQWHAEALIDHPEHLALFAGLVAAAAAGTVEAAPPPRARPAPSALGPGARARAA